MDKTAKQTKLIVWEPNGSGHRFMYVKFIAQHALANGIPFLIQTTVEAKSLPEWKVHGLDSYPHDVSESLADVVKTCIIEPEYTAQIIVPDADRWLLQCLVQWKSLHQHPVSLLIMRPIAGKSLSSRINHLAKLVLLATIRLTFNKASVFALLSHGMGLPVLYNALGIKSIFDPVEWNPTMTRVELGLRPDQIGKTLFLVAGELSERKYISEIVNAWDSVKPGKAILVLVGRVASNLASEVNGAILRNHSILYIDDYVSNETFDSWIDVADYVFILQRNAGSSGIALKASNSNATIICGGIASHVSNVRALNNNYQELTKPSIASISEFLSTSKTSIRKNQVSKNFLFTSEWVKKFTETQQRLS